MNYVEFLDKIITDRIKTISFATTKDQREGALSGLLTCRNQTFSFLIELRDEARYQVTRAEARIKAAGSKEASAYTFMLHSSKQIAWILDCVNAYQVRTGKPSVADGFVSSPEASFYVAILLKSEESVPSCSVRN